VVSIPPPGFVPPAPVVYVAAASVLGDLRDEDRRPLDSRRLGARVIDSLIVAPIFAVMQARWGAGVGNWILLGCITLVYHHLCEVTRGGSFGKRAVGLRVADLDTGAIPTPRQAAARGVIGLIEIPIIATISIFATGRARRRLGDLAGGTAVVDARRHPADRRSHEAGMVVYPVLWILATCGVGVAQAKGLMPGSFRHRADAICAQANAISARIDLQAAGNLQMHLRLDTEELSALQRLTVPAAWRSKREMLLVEIARVQTARAIVGAEGAAEMPQLAAAKRHAHEAIEAGGFTTCATVP
jgi:uncharacterized RDD family membrane protein YckC